MMREKHSGWIGTTVGALPSATTEYGLFISFPIENKRNV